MVNLLHSSWLSHGDSFTHFTSREFVQIMSEYISRYVHIYIYTSTTIINVLALMGVVAMAYLLHVDISRRFRCFFPRICRAFAETKICTSS